MPRYFIFIVFFIFLGRPVFAQVKDSTVSVFFEKVYLHTDRDVYAQGEDIWFKAYLVNAQTNDLINYSYNLYVELISPSAKIVSRKVLRLENGLSNGDFKLADSLPAGNYRIRAYTNWMRNFGDNFVFEKPIRIVYNLESALTPQKLSNNKKPGKAVLIPHQNLDTLPTVRFFPEGGSLIDGVSSVVGVKAEDANGYGIAATGSVTDNSGDIIARFTCDSLGFGAFTLIPDAVQKYSSSAIIKGSRYQFVLPAIQQQGFGLHVQPKGDMLTIAIFCNDLTFKKAVGRHLYLTVKHSGKTYLRRSLSLNSKDQLISFSNGQLPEGINCITLSDEQSRPLCERLVFVHHPGDVQLSVSTDKQVYQANEKVTVQLKLNKPAVTNLSMAVVDAATVPVQSQDILSYLNLQSEIKGRIERPVRYFDTINVNRSKQLDLLLLTQGWRNFVWKQLEDTVLKITHEVEQGITITGRVRKEWSDKPLRDIHIAMYAPKAEGAKFFEANTDTAGRFAIYGAVFYGYQYIYLSSRNYSKKANGKRDSGGWIKVDSLNRDTLPVIPVNQAIRDTSPSNEELLLKLGIPKKQLLKEVEIKAKVFREIPPEIHTLTMKEYKDYGNVLQYLLSTIDGSHAELSADGKLRLTGTVLCNLTFPVINVFGIYADGSAPGTERIGQDILALPITSALSVKISKHVDPGGCLITSVNLKLRPGAFAMKDYFDNTTADMVGYYKALEFYKPKFGEIDNKPDPRYNTIYWEPNITTDKNGEATITFYHTNTKTKVIVSAEGITDIGEPVAASATYTVR